MQPAVDKKNRAQVLRFAPVKADETGAWHFVACTPSMTSRAALQPESFF
jgi:hypothetical protein